MDIEDFFCGLFAVYLVILLIAAPICYFKLKDDIAELNQRTELLEHHGKKRVCQYV